MCDRVAVMYLGKIVEIGPQRGAVQLPAPPLHGRAAGGGAGRRSGPCAGSSAVHSAVTCRVPRTRRAAAVSTRAARRRRRCAPNASRCSRTRARRRSPPATSRSATRRWRRWAYDLRDERAPRRDRPSGAEAEELLARLIRFNTVNPPGNERAAQEYLAGHLSAGGIRVRAARRRTRSPQPGRAPARPGPGRRGRPDAVLPRPRRHGARQRG